MTTETGMERLRAENKLPTDPSIPGRPPDVEPFRWSSWHIPECMAVFFLGFMMMSFMYSGTGGVLGNELGVPGNDDFYHVKMAAMIPEIGLVHEFPWLRFCYFTKNDDSFVSHHYGFHVLMVPFVTLSSWLYNGDTLTGGRWAICTFFALWLAVFNLILISERIRWRWIWLIVLLVLPSQFFGRHVFVRAISPSLLFMFLIIFLMFRRRYVWLAVAIAAYNHLYLGAVMYSPVIVGCYAVALLVGPGNDREVPLKLVVSSFLGWLIGALTYPYSAGMLEFLKLQVFGTGLSPDIPVGTEWKPYGGSNEGNIWWFAQMVGSMLIVWTAALCARVRFGPVLNTKETSLLLMNFAFLVLCLKARRFIEYWPAFCFISAAFMAAPLINRVAEIFDRGFDQVASSLLNLGTALAAAVVSVIAVLLYSGKLGSGGWTATGAASLQDFAVEWQLWVVLATLFLLGPLAQSWLSDRDPELPRSHRLMSMAGFLFCLALFVGSGIALLQLGLGFKESMTPKIEVAGWGWGLAAVTLIGVVVLGFRSVAPSNGYPPVLRMLRGFTVAVGGIAIFVTAVQAGARPLVDRQRDTRCEYNLPAIRGAMDYLKTHSQPGDVIFTDDWDVFPVFFYYNSYNHYIVGLDPKFTHHRNPELWERYVKVSRGQAPSTVEVKVKDDDGKETRHRINVKLTDIREHFGARYAVTDRDHKELARKLSEAPDVAELVYPSNSYEKVKNEPYLVFRILEPGEAPTSAPAVPKDPDVLYLSDMTPVSAHQGYGELMMDRSVEGGPLAIGSQVYTRGIGTHAVSRLEYAVPEGFDSFRAKVGVNQSTEARGSIIVSVELDGKEVFKSALLTGGDKPVEVNVALSGAQKLILKSSDADDTNRFDHTDWAEARFFRERR